VENDFEGIEYFVYTEDAMSTNIIKTNTSKKRTLSFSEDDSVDDLFNDESYCPDSETKCVINPEPINNNEQPIDIQMIEDETNKSDKKKVVSSCSKRENTQFT